MFSCEVCKISKNTIFIEHLRATASELTEMRQQVWLLIFIWLPTPKTAKHSTKTTDVILKEFFSKYEPAFRYCEIFIKEIFNS